MGWGTVTAFRITDDQFAEFLANVSDSDFLDGQGTFEIHQPNAIGDHNLQGASSKPDTKDGSPLASHFPEVRGPRDAHTSLDLGDSDQPTANELPGSKKSAQSAPTSPAGHEPADAQDPGAGGGSETSEGQGSYGHQSRLALGSKPADDQGLRDPQSKIVVGAKLAAGHGTNEVHSGPAGSDQTTTTGHEGHDSHTGTARGGWLRDPVLGILADVLDDYEKVRIANDNRVRQLTRTEEDSDGEERGFGLTLDHPNVARLQASVVALADAEADAVKNLQKAMKTHPLGPWVKAQAGIGEKQAARLLATIGDPFWNDLHQRPRTVSELWAYCGYAVNNGHAQGRRRGEQANWSADAKMRAFLIAASCIKQPAAKSKYRRIYDDARAKYADVEHPHECKRCGPAGKPAQPGSPLSAGHQHARAMRLMSKEILKDLWIESKRLYEEGAS